MKMNAQKDAKQKSCKKLVEGVDFYYNEFGYFVFTESYLKQRGHCCKNNCKHCPYGIHNG
jgi:hypothetical protein